MADSIIHCGGFCGGFCYPSTPTKLHNAGMKESMQKNAVTLMPGGGPTLMFMGMHIAYKVSAAETDGAWALLELLLPPHFSGLPLHWHESTHQGFYVLQGRITFQLGTQIFTADPGAFVDVPTYVRHTFGNLHDQPARLLEVIMPGGLEDSFKELISFTQSEPALLLQPHKLMDLFERYDTFLQEEK